MTTPQPNTIQEILIALLHKFDHEPDEITKFVVIDQKEFVPEATQAIKDYILKEIIGDDEKHKNGQTLVNPWVCDDCGTPEESYARNALRATQRAKLGVDNERR